MNGRCNDRGKCICSLGFQGRFCTISACANNCSSHGQCVPVKIDQTTTNIVVGNEDDEMDEELDNQNIEYKCTCSIDWTGTDCSFRFERNCADDLDNDNGKFLFNSNFIYLIAILYLSSNVFSFFYFLK